MPIAVFQRVMSCARSVGASLRTRARELKGSLYDALLGIEAGADLQYPTDRFLERSQDVSVHKDMFIYGPVFYGMLARISRMLYWTANDVFVDLGCGKGRAVFYMARQRIKKVIGVELDEDLLAVAGKNLRTFRGGRAPVELVHADAARYRFTDENIIFINNAFGHETLEKVLAHLRDSLAAAPRKIIILYLNPEHKNVMDAQAWLTPAEHTAGMDTCYIWSNR